MDLKFFKTVPTVLNVTTVFALFFLCFKILVLNSIPEIFPKAHELGLIFQAILVSIIASYIFYLIVVHKKKIDEKRNIYPHVKKWAELVVRNNKTQLSSFSKESGIELNFENLDKNELNKAFEKINPQTDAPLAISANKHANWFQYLDFFRQKSQTNIDKILKQIIYVDPKLIALTVKISDSTHFDIVKMINYHKMRNMDMSSFSKSFYQYYEYCYELDKYLENEFENIYVG